MRSARELGWTGRWPSRLAAVAAALAILMSAPQSSAQNEVTEAGYQAWIAQFRIDARSEGISEATLERAFDGLTLYDRVVELDRNQPEFSRPVWEYLDAVLSDRRIEQGLLNRARWLSVMEQIEETYALPPHVLTAYWGIESNYGANTGGFDVIRALSTMAYEGRRGRFFRENLILALLIMQNGDAGDRRLMGSWAGAMGHTQTIPAVYMESAVDFNGDGRRDVWSQDPGDALATTANYLSRFEYRRGEPILFHVTLPSGFDYAAAAASRRTTDAWSALGLRLANGAPLPGGYEEAAFLLPAGARGPAFLTLHNYRVIRRYNPADSYALAVTFLSERLDGQPPRDFTWPRDDRPLSRTERRELQERLTALGHDTQGVDGILGPNSRAAIRSFQTSQGVIADGYPSAQLLVAIRLAAGVDPAEAAAAPPSQEVSGPSTAEVLPEARVRELQALLNLLGYDAGEVDGRVGGQTLEASSRAVRALGLDLPPEPSSGLLDALRAAATGN